MEKDILKRYDKSFYKMMAEHFGGEIFVTDGDGVTLFVNPEAVRVIGKPVHEIVGRNVRELVEEGFFKPSATLEVLKQRKQVDIIQTVKDGNKVLCTGTPVFDEMQENIRMVISTTRDVKLFNQLYEEMEQQKEELSNLRDMVFEEDGMVIGSDDAGRMKTTLMKLANLDVPILITGETGVGKGVAAKAIHSIGRGKNRPMIKINCGIIPENLIESELFGYEKGAFTGAVSSKKGKVEMAEGGTLFLDEIGEMPLSLQVKLLDFLQDGTFTRVGGTKERKVSTRIIAATNRDLEKMCREGSFRQDLYYRINVMPFEIPPLRARLDDLDTLTKYFLFRCNQKYGENKEFSEKAQETLRGYGWPGNVRQLEHVIERTYVMTEDGIITDKDLKHALAQEATGGVAEQPQLKCTGLMPLKDAKWELERQLVSEAYRQYGNTYKVANALKIDQSTVVKLLKKHDIK